MTTITEGQHAGEFLVSEAEGSRSRDAITVASGQNLSAGAVLGKITRALAAAPIPAVVGTGNGLMSAVKPGINVQTGNYVVTCTAAAANGGTFSVVAPDGTALSNATVGTAYKSSHIDFLISDGSTDFIVGDVFTIAVTAGGTPVVVGTGNGTIGTISMGRETAIGTYRLQCTAAAANAGTFAVIAPDGSRLPDATVAVAYASEQINFTIADGSTDFIVGDYFHVVVAKGSGKCVAVSATAVDGSEDAYGILFDNTDATSADKAGVAITRDAEVNAAELQWGATISAAHKAVFLSLLKTNNGIVAR